MTRKHYEQIAASFKAAIQRASTDYEALALETLAIELAETFQQSNERFNKDIFLRACSVSK
jgi:hypothetical protein